jgi:hypothetical protein
LKLWWHKPNNKEPLESINATSEVNSRILYLPRAILRSTHEHFLPYWEAKVETAVFWAGLELGTLQVVTTLVSPGLRQTWGNYQVTRESLRRMARVLNEQDLTILSQVHTHPGDWVDHSEYDDQHAYSTSDGALSFVWPSHGYSFSYGLEGVGIHECHKGQWLKLELTEIRSRIKIIDSFVDFRWEISKGGIANAE